jgi:cytochrome c-type biogenesis protein CcmH/NrfG
MRRFVLPAFLIVSILVTTGTLTALRSPGEKRDARVAATASTGPSDHDAKDAEPSRAIPVDADGWQSLGREESAQGHHAMAVVAFRHATRLRPDDATLLSDYAFSAAATTRRTEDDDPQRLVDIALQLDPTNLKALTLAGTLALDRGDYETAAQDWERLARLEPADSPMRREVESSAAQARSLASAHAGRIQLARADIRARPRQ